jgi:hypothetical protein
MTPRRFPPPWSAELQLNHYVVRDANRQQLAYVYYENEPGRRSAAKLLTKDETQAAQKCATVWSVALPSSSRKWRRFCAYVHHRLHCNTQKASWP